MNNVKLIYKTIECVKRFLETPPGQIVFEVVKFFFVYFLLAALAGILFVFFVIKILEPHHVVIDNITIDSKEHANPDFDKTGRDLALVSRLFPIIPFALAFFAVFFTRPPKALKHVCVTTFFVFLIWSIPLFQKPVLLAVNFFAFYAFALAAWLGSLAWFRFRKSRLPYRPECEFFKYF